jgi:hypothetical protein
VPSRSGRRRLDLRRDDGEAFAAFAGALRLDGGIEREQVGLPGDGADQPDDLADMGRGAAELRHGAHRALRLGDARPATSVERVACWAIPAIEAAKLLDRARGCRDVAGGGADALLGGAGIGGDLVGGAVELGGGDVEPLRSRTLARAWSTEVSKRLMVAAIASARASRAWLVSARAARRRRSSRNTATDVPSRRTLRRRLGKSSRRCRRRPAASSRRRARRGAGDLSTDQTLNAIHSNAAIRRALMMMVRVRPATS